MLFEKGSRIRLAITGANEGSTFQQVLDPAPTLTVFSGGVRASTLSLPLLENTDELEFNNGLATFSQ